MSRLPIRVRLAVGFAIAMAVVLVAVGGLLYVRTGSALLEQVDNGLEAHVETVGALAREDGDFELRPADDEGFVQVIGADGQVRLSSSIVAGTTLVSAAEVERGRSAAFFTEREGLGGLDGARARLLVGPSGDGEVVVVGASLDDREEALAGLARELLVVGPVALVLTSMVGYVLAGAALRPVERMRAEAAAVSAGAARQRLSLPVARDEVYRLGVTLNEMIGRLEASVARERAFVADASHELRTPLAALQTELELALRRPRTAEEAMAALRSVEEEVTRLTRLAEDLLTLARLEDGDAGRLARAPVAVRALCERVAARFAARAAAEGRAIEVVGADGLYIEGDEARLEQAVGNLVDNALWHGAGAVGIDVRALDRATEIEVSDEGPGFAPEFAGRAFERFARADPARAGGGAGLGLSIVEAVARAHGGSAHIGRSASGGASVVLRLPRFGGAASEVTHRER